MNTQQVKVYKVKTNPDNPRLIKDRKFKKLVRSIKEFPEMLKIRPIVVDENNIILGGNMRYKACIEAGLKEIYIIQAKDLNEDQKKEFIIKDNVGFGEWDWDIIANDWDIGKLNDWGVDLIDFESPAEVKEDNYTEPKDIKVDVVLGDIIEIGEHRLLCGDSTDENQVNKLMNKKKADMVFTDPPYNALKSWNKSEAKAETRLNPNDWFNNDNMDWKDFDQFLLNVFKQYNTHSIYICCDFRIYDRIKKHIKTCNYILKHCIVWKKNIWGLGKRYRFQHEFIVYATKKNNSPFYGDKSQSDVWEIDVDRTTNHNTPKPIGLPYKAILNSSKKNEIILDTFLGSGSTMAAAHQLKRKCYAMELDPKYCQITIDRMLKLDPQIEIKINGKKYGQK